MKNDMLKFLFKGILLLILDVVTFVIVFSAWAIVNIKLFPWAFIAILFSLIMVNIIVLFSDLGISFLGVGVYTSILASTFLYYIFVMSFTGITYIGISPRWYIITFLIITLLYLGSVFGMYISGINKFRDMERQEIEKENILDITLQLMKINQNINNCTNIIEKSFYTTISESFNEMEERLRASTPFGRVIKPIVLNLENEIINKLDIINEELILINSSEEKQSDYIDIIKELSDVKSLIINREKVIIQ